MHPNEAFHWTDRADALAFVAANAWSRIFVTTPSGPRVAHAPVIVDPVAGTLRFHLARRNAIHDALDGATALALFEGPHAYVSANWYPDPARQVPTWNYIAVECEGPVSRIDPSYLLPMLDALSPQHEAAVGENWSRARSDEGRIAALLHAITAFELRITDLRGTRKLSQNKPGEIATVARGVEQSGANELAALMRAACA